MAKVFFDYVFGIDDGGFYHTLDELFSPYRSQKDLEQISYATLGGVQNTDYSITVSYLKLT